MTFFPIQVPYARTVLVGPRSIAWAIVEPFEARAQANHGQTLQRLAQRGGLSPRELACLLTDQPWSAHKQWIDEQDALDFVASIIEDHRTAE